MNRNAVSLLLTSTVYFNCWMTLIVIYQLTGVARIAGAFVTLWILVKILSSASDPVVHR
ncbi:MAG: hypothetical protein QM764_11715 [Chitinophagaceae bacterium]